MQNSRLAIILAATGALALFGGPQARALEPPRPGEIERLREQGRLEEQIAAAEELGNHRVRPQLAQRAKYRLQQQLLRQSGAVPDESTLPTPPPAWQGMATTGSVKVFALLIAFSDYPQTTPSTTVDSSLFGTGNSANFPYESLRNYYQRSSYNQLDIGGTTFDWYTTTYPRSQVPQTYVGRQNLIKEALNHYEAQGHDFSQYDSNNGGAID
jgi:hypothetical protein